MKSVALHSKLNKLLLKSFTIILLFAMSLSSYSQEEVDATRQSEGRKLFKSLCSTCHKLDKKYVGPMLGGVEERRENSWLIAWIKNNAALRASGDRDAIAIYEEYNGSVMSSFQQLSDAQINDILYYTTVGDPVKTPVPGTNIVGGGTGDQGNSPQWIIYLLAGAIVVAFLMIAGLLKQVNELKGNTTPETKSNLKRDLHELWEGIKGNTFLHVVTTIFVLLMGAYIVFGTLFKVGVNEGYMPLQPIAFSHKIHSGENKIECQYCHSSAKHSKHSGIPSVNVCMNCHMNIAEVAEGTKVEWDGVTYGKAELDKEIAKIYEASGWDPETLEYTGEEKPIKWIRIHNLPDFAYFNHSQHVTVGGIECQKCHGPVEEYDEMRQFSPLTMGWCINCHRETNVDLKGNEYYEKIHNELAQKYGVEQVTIAQLGGLECGKCHY
jgi:mono/diheme cytochrome c family protein